MCYQMSSSTSREVIVSGEPWSAHPSPPLVPFPLGGLSDGGLQRVGVATRSGVVLRCNWQVCCFGAGTNQSSIVVIHLVLWLYL